MEESITQTTEKNVVVRDWSLKTQKEKGDSLVEGCVANLLEYVTVNVHQNNLEDLVWIWNQWDSDTRGIFAERYGDIAKLIAEDMTPTIEEYAALLRIDNICRRKGEGRFIGCAQLLNVWILSHFWKVKCTPFHMFSKTFSPLEAYLKKEWPKEVTEQHWVSVFQNLRAEDITWRAPWILPSVLLYRVRDQDWVPLLGLWGGARYAPLLVQRQFSSR
ncbi:hypothetical protein CXB51_009615 [Gossypium anomalum]|uniref:DUF7745 domain-containing protein n=1 Tax=Gossypium anomalum TaxID=47600 RepID=A0A8J5ZML0_9ROSI|nr:hypothetical protein CXB51_009615 [Gossypium anomalum]